MQLSLLLNQGPILETMLSTHIPAKARSSDPETSHQAAAKWTPKKLTEVQEDVLSFFKAKGKGTDLEMEIWVQQQNPAKRYGASSLRKRRGDLAKMGKVECRKLDDGKFETEVFNGSRAMVWRLK